MEVLSTVEGLESLEPTQVNARLLPLKDWNAGEDSYYADMLEELNTGHTAPFIYSGWENLAVPMGEKMIDYICGNATLDEVIACFDESQHLVTEDITPYYTTVTETISTEDCAKLVGICFGEATGADAALISVNEWNYNLETNKMNAQGVSGNLFPLPTGDEEIVSVFPTGWHDNIRTLTMTGSQIKELAAVGYDAYGNGSTFPYVLVTKGGMERDDDTTYTIPVCGATEKVAEAAGGFTDSGVSGLDAAREYLSQFETLSAEDIVWE